MTYHLLCPVCRTYLHVTPTTSETWGVIPITDVGIGEVTLSGDSEASEHIRSHMKDGSYLKALREHDERMSRWYADRLARWEAADAT